MMFYFDLRYMYLAYSRPQAYKGYKITPATNDTLGYIS
jgi:hypothetical protein